MYLLNFSHGGDIKAFQKKYNLDKVIDLSSNINFVKPKVKLDIDVSSYPNYSDFYKVLSRYFKVNKNYIEIFNGGSSAIFYLFAYIRNFTKKVYIYSPAYLEYKKASLIYNFDLKLLNRLKKLDYKIEKNSFVVFVNPSTPDGKYYKLDKLIKYWIKQECYILVDESFLEFAQKKSIKKYLNYEKLFILRSMTKFFASAGVRVGVLLNKNIKDLSKYIPNWQISSYDKAYITQAINKKFIKKSLKKNKKAKKRLLKKLKKSKYIDKIYKSNANFFLVKLNITAKQYQKKLLKYNVMVRNCSNFDFLNNKFVRIAVKNKISYIKF